MTDLDNFFHHSREIFNLKNNDLFFQKQKTSSHRRGFLEQNYRGEPIGTRCHPVLLIFLTV
jgi:hypothetical protein